MNCSIIDKLDLTNVSMKCHFQAISLHKIGETFTQTYTIHQVKMQTNTASAEKS